MKTAAIAVIAAGMVLLGIGRTQAQFASGNLVVSVIKSANGQPPLSVAQQRILREFSLTGAATGKEFLLPTTASGSNKRLTNSKTNTSPTEGAVSLSADGRYLLISGYDAALGTSNVAGTSSTATPRVIGRIEWRISPAAGAMNTSTAITDGFGQNTVRSVASQDGTGFWVSGGGTGTGGVHYVLLGSTGTSVTLQTTGWDMRGVLIFNGQLYATCNSPNLQGVGKLGDGLPTDAPQTFVLLPGFSDSSLRLHGFWFADATTLYVADDRSNNSTTPVGGLQKWVYDSILTQAWSNVQTFRLITANSGNTSVGAYAVTGTHDAQNNPVIYVMATDSRLWKLTDTGASPTPEVIAAAPQDEIWRGVVLLPAQAGGGDNGATISGTVTLQGCASAAVPLTFQFKPISGTTVTQTVTPAPNGSFTTQPFPRTFGSLAVRASNTLQEVRFVTLMLGNVQNTAFTLLAGDANGDNYADINDLLLLIAHYNQASFDGNYLPAADFNRDGFNDIGDLLLLIGNYNRMGAFLP